MHNLLVCSDEVNSALKNHEPIVALESTIISHGLPSPQNLETALAVESIIREKGAVPATIAIIKGKIHIGLNQEQLIHLAQDTKIHKASRRDLAYMLSQKYSASTTVAATMLCAHLANIKIFATGGIGGVHRGATESFDISADLIELSKTPVHVFCAGAKSILDLSKTLEYLETHGVPVIGYRTTTFPAFYSQSSNINLCHTIDTPLDLSEYIKLHDALGLRQGSIIANPIPKADEIPYVEMETLITKAHTAATNISGKALTPFLLEQLCLLSDGKTLIANTALIKNNAKLAAQCANYYYN